MTGLVRNSHNPGLPNGTLLSGYLWTGGEGIVGRYTQAQLPDGRTVPVCIETGEQGFVRKLEESTPGAAVSIQSVPAYPVERWH
ncbi:hypothetical protein D7V97_31805 [Corallococcus sp. CA053C]|nr:hypothetical protein D7V97_31805 [Corallococcus sp. CA053C]